MSQIPEGTQYIEAGCGEKGFRKYEKGRWWFFEGFWRHVDWTMGDLKPVTEHPFYAAPADNWTGEGLPPVGTELEAGFACEEFENWHKGICVASGEDPEGREEFCVVQFGNKLAMYTTKGRRMRPIRTPEQIAADERLHKVRNALTAIGKVIEIWNASTDCSAAMRATVEAMIDAGYRKEPTQ